jgi:virginiamycin B lyase
MRIRRLLGFAAICVAISSSAAAQARTLTEFTLPSGSQPAGIAVGPDGNIWFTECFGNKIGRIAHAGEITEFLIPTPGSCPADITSGPDGNLWFTEFSVPAKIGRVTVSGVITEFALPTVSSGPTVITAGPDGNLWFTEFFANQIGRITPLGVIAEFAIPSSGPAGITSGPDGNLWFTEANSDRIARMSTAGVIVSEFTLAGARVPVGITSAPDGTVWFTHQTRACQGGAARITVDGAVTFVSFVSGLPFPVITSGPDGNLWFPDPCTDTGIVGSITAAGLVTKYPVSTGLSTSLFPPANDIVVDSEGNVWFTEPGGDRIGRLAVVRADTEPPVLTVPSPITVDADSPAGAAVLFAASATDNIDPDVPVTCTPASGSIFPVGTTTVNCSATDAAGNTASAAFDVVVRPFVVPFAAFLAEVEVKEPGQVEVKGTFHLGAMSDGIQPANETVTLRVGGFEVTIAAGSFVADDKGRFRFRGAVNGITLDGRIRPLTKGGFEFKADLPREALMPLGTHVEVSLTIGNDTGATTAAVHVE